MPGQSKRSLLPLVIMIAATATSMLFWSYFSYVKYHYFQDAFFDIGQAVYSMYYTLHYMPAYNWLQYLVFAQHITLDQYIVLPFFAAAPSGLTLMFFQAAVVSLTGLLIFYIVRGIFRNSALALALGIAYLINPGVMGMLIYDYHAEFFIVPFMLLTSFFYVKRNWAGFIPSLLLLLFSIDTALPLVVTLGIGLLYYEMVYRKKRIDATRLKMALCIVVSALVLSGIFFLIEESLLVSYGTGMNGTPFALRINPYFPAIIDYLTGKNLLPAPYYDLSATKLITGPLSLRANFLASPSVYLYAIFAGILFLAPAVLVDPVLTLIIDAPWLYWLASGYIIFGYIEYQYFSYVIGGSIVACILGMILLKERRGIMLRAFRLDRAPPARLFSSSVKWIIIMSSAVGFSGIVLNSNYNFITLAFMFGGLGSGSAQCDAQLYSIIGMVPQNAQLLTQTFITPHVATREYLSTFGGYGPSPNATYALADFGSCLDTYFLANQTFNQANIRYLQEHNYTIYAQNGTAVLYRRGG